MTDGGMYCAISASDRPFFVLDQNQPLAMTPTFTPASAPSSGNA